MFFGGLTNWFELRVLQAAILGRHIGLARRFQPSATEGSQVWATRIF